MLALIHIHRLTDNGKVVSLPKKINFEVPKFDKYPSFSKLSSYSLRQPSSPLETCSSGLFWSVRPPWIAPPREKKPGGPANISLRQQYERLRGTGRLGDKRKLSIIKDTDGNVAGTTGQPQRSINMGVYGSIAVLRFFSSGISVILVFMCGIAVSSSPAVYGFASFG